jgi:hypothetical protein
VSSPYSLSYNFGGGGLIGALLAADDTSGHRRTLENHLAIIRAENTIDLYSTLDEQSILLISAKKKHLWAVRVSI